MDAVSITVAKAAKITKLRHRPLMLLREFTAPPPLFAVGLSAALQTGCASVRARKRASDVSSQRLHFG
jgi:hypothetical protein